MQDPFEESLRDLLKAPTEQSTDQARLSRVLKTANRQVGVGDLFSLIGHWLETVILAICRAGPHLKPVSRLTSSADKAD